MSSALYLQLFSNRAYQQMIKIVHTILIFFPLLIMSARLRKLFELLNHMGENLVMQSPLL